MITSSKIIENDVTYYSLTPELRTLPISDKKVWITNWEWIKREWFEKRGLKFNYFYQNKDTVFLCNDKVWEGMPIAKIGYWPDIKEVPFEHVKIERRVIYTVLFKQRWLNFEFESTMVIDQRPSAPLPEVIGKRIVRQYDDVAIYIGPIKNHYLN